MDSGRAPPTSRHPSITAGSRPAVTAAREKGWRPLICDEVRRHDRCAEVVVLKVRSGPGGARKLYAVFDRSLLDHRTPFVARRKPDGTVEVSTLNTQIAVPGELRLIAHESPERLPQPWRDKVKGIQVARVAPPIAEAAQPKPATPPAAIDTAAKAPRPDPGTVHITYKHRRPDSVKPKARKPFAQEPPTAPNTTPATQSNTGRQAAPPSVDARQRHRSANEPQPLTNMALAFQKLAKSDPEVEQLLITGFRGSSDAA